MRVGLYIFFSILCSPCLLSAQEMADIVIRKVFISGNKRTHDRIILRELDIHPGDTISLLRVDTLLKANRNRVYNTRLFNSVDMVLLPDSANRKDLLIEVKERWYIFPIPIFELADRSFNEWWYNQGRDLSRVNYGMRFSDKNFRGRKEELKLTLQAGFTSKLGLGYNVPYLNKKQTVGMDLNLTYDQNKQISYRTESNKQLFLKKEDLLRERYKASLTFFYRKSFFGTHFFEFAYNYNTVTDTIVQLNPSYFGEGKRQRYGLFRYTFSYDKRDVRAYAHKGYFWDIQFEQNGITPWEDVQYSVLESTFSKYFSLPHHFIVASLSKVKGNVFGHVPYFNIRALGYDQDYVRGYDLYVVDAPFFALQRVTLRKLLFQKELNFRSLVPIEQFNALPMAVYLTSYYDLGYTYSKALFPGNSYLGNELLRGGGFGVDVVTYYDNVFRFEYSINKMLESRVYLAFTTDI